jgi:hypothetical protein
MKHLVILLDGFEILNGLITDSLARNGLASIAVTLPPQDAGRNIRDEELAWFYHELMKDIGWTVDSN